MTVSGNELGAFFIAVVGAEAAVLPRICFLQYPQLALPVNRRRFAFAGTSRSEPAFSLDLPVFRTSSIKSHYILARRGRSYNQKVWK